MAEVFASAPWWLWLVLALVVVVGLVAASPVIVDGFWEFVYWAKVVCTIVGVLVLAGGAVVGLLFATGVL